MMKLPLLVTFLFCLSTYSQVKNVFDTARSGTLKEIQDLNALDSSLINSVDKNQSSPLILACYRGNIEVAKFLAKNVKDINYASEMGTALMAATYKNEVDLVKFLLENKANPNSKDANGATALLLAVQFKNMELVSLLLKYNADKTLKDDQGKTAFEYAVFSGNEQLINLLK